MSDRLRDIIAYKGDEVAALKRARPWSELSAGARAASPVRDFAGALLSIAAADGNALICEVKRKSPSAGDIDPACAPEAVARAYEAGGAACVSVLTDGPSFGGLLQDMIDVRAAISLPVLRKDFLVDPVQVVEARAAGADAILIILAAVEDGLARELHAAADEFGLSVLLEAHNEDELARALTLPSRLIGVNNRDLRSFTTDLGVTERLAAMAPANRLLISESGIKTAEDVVRLRACGARGFLIGETVMRASDPEGLVRIFVNAR
ncbi:MAG: indole-3-glycerol phosphate synthase TrpC [Alphaproteobacteria bacterium]|nr:indole-3-glycerol phosphate synthase TrpC [Alphaproteobacteria bacterium]